MSISPEDIIKRIRTRTVAQSISVPVHRQAVRPISPTLSQASTWRDVKNHRNVADVEVRQLNYPPAMTAEMIQYCVASKTGSDAYFLSFIQDGKYKDFAFFNGYPIPYRIFCMFILKVMYKSYTLPEDEWDIINNDLHSIFKEVGMVSKTRADHMILKMMREKFKSISDEAGIKELQTYLASMEERFVDARAQASTIL